MRVRRYRYMPVQRTLMCTGKASNVQRDEDVIYKLRTRVDVYEDSVYQHHKMVEVASYKDSIARQLIDESNRIKMQINSKKSK